MAYKDLNIKANGVVIPKGVLLPIIEDVGSGYVKVDYQGEGYFLKKGKINNKGKKYCTPDYKCFRLNKRSAIYKRPKFSSKKIRIHKKSDELSWTGQRLSKNKGKKRKWYQVISDGDYGWVPASKGKLNPNQCIAEGSQRNLFLEADYGYMTSVAADSYSYLLTTVPDPSAVACLQNPIVSSVSPGSGHRVGAGGVYNFNSWLSARVGAHFERVTYQVNLLDNPHPDPGNTSCALIDVSLSSLSARTISITESNLVLPIGLIYRLRLGQNHHLMLSGHFNSIYNIQEEQNLEFFTGQTLSKQTSNSYNIGVDTFRTNIDFELRYIYNFPIDRDDTLGFSIFAKKFQSATSFGLGVVL